MLVAVFNETFSESSLYERHTKCEETIVNFVDDYSITARENSIENETD